jgi:hypothetical protein
VWDVELRARLGPLARSKRLRMVRTVRDPETFTATFERDQADGRNHSPWTAAAGELVLTNTKSACSIACCAEVAGTMSTFKFVLALRAKASRFSALRL